MFGESSALVTAISLWRAGRRISLVLFSQLREEGYDVPSLERAYSNQPGTGVSIRSRR